jgi:hypothetical protein
MRYLIEIRQIVSEMKQADRQTDTNSSPCVHFLHSVQIEVWVFLLRVDNSQARTSCNESGQEHRNDKQLWSKFGTVRAAKPGRRRKRRKRQKG